MLVKIVTIVATVAVLAVVFLPFVASRAADVAVETTKPFYCTKCNRGYDEITWDWHRRGMHSELVIETIDDECTVGPAQVMAKAQAPAAEPAPEPERVVEVRSGDVVYRVFTGGRK